jgi:hypothetical protein
LGLALGVALLLTIASTLSSVDTDIVMYWNAVHRAFDQGVDPYRLQAGDKLLFVYPPSALFLLYPLSKLDLAQAATLMLTVNLFLSVALMALIVNDLAHDDPSGRLAWWGPLYFAAFGGNYLNMVFCQVNLVALLFLWLYWRQVRRSRPTRTAGVALVFGALAKPHYGLLALGAGPKPGLRIILGASLAGTALLVASLLLLPEGLWHSWFEHVVAETSYTALPGGRTSIAAPWNRSVPGLFGRLFIPNKFSVPLVDSPAAAHACSTAVVLVLLALSAWALYRSMRRGDRGPRDRDLELSLMSLLAFLASPASWTHHLVMLLPAALVMLRDVVLDPKEPMSQRLTVGLTLALIAVTFEDLIPRDVRTSSLAMMSLMTVAILALWSLTAVRLLRRSAGVRVPAH